MVLLDERNALIVERAKVDGRTQVDIAREVHVSRYTVSRIIEQFDTEFACIIGPDSKFSPGYIRDLIVRLLGNAKTVRESAAA